MPPRFEIMCPGATKCPPLHNTSIYQNQVVYYVVVVYSTTNKEVVYQYWQYARTS